MKYVFKLSLSGLILILFSVSGLHAQGGEGLDDYVKAKSLFEQEKYAESFAAFDMAIKKEPGEIKYLFEKCNCIHGLRTKPAKTVECFLSYKKAADEKGVVTDKSAEGFDEVSYKNYVLAHELIAMNYSNAGKTDDAVNYYQIAYEINPDVAFKYQILELLFKEGRAVEAAPHIAAAKKNAPDDFMIKYFEARYNNVLGNHEKGVELMEGVFETFGGLGTVVQDEFEKFYYEIGYAYHMTGNYDKSRKAFSYITESRYFKSKIEDLSSENYLKIAQAYQKIYEIETSKKYIDVAKAKDPTNEAIKKLSQELEDDLSSDNKEAISKWVSRLENKKNPPTSQEKMKIFYQLTHFNFHDKNYADALKMANEFLAVKPNDPHMLFMRGLTLFKLGDNDEAEYVFDTIAKTKTIPPGARVMSYFALGIVQRKTEQYDRAVKNLRKALSGPFGAAAKQEIININKQLQVNAGG